MSAFSEFVALVEARTGRPGKRQGRDVRLLCPAHDDTTPSLDVAEGDDGRPLVQCRSRGCSWQSIAGAVGWQAARGSGPAIVAEYDYRDEAGELLYQAVRLAPKDFRQRRPDGRGGWEWKLGDTRRVLFRLPAVREAAAAGGLVFVVEGEKDVHALEACGLVATTSAAGAGKWRPEYAEQLDGARVVVIPDDDRAGREHADRVLRSLEAAGVKAALLDLAPEPGDTKADVSDWLAAARGDDERAQAARLLAEMAEATLKRRPGPQQAASRLLDGAAFLLDEPTDLTPVWGSPDAPLWASGEGLLIVGPDGVGKTTLMQQVCLGRMGLRADVLGLPVTVDERPVLYIAADRPRQAQRSLARMVTEADRATLRDRLLVWRGPLPFDVAATPDALVRFALEHGAGTVAVDSLKDIAADLTKDETGGRLNQAFQHVIAAGIELVASHHQRKEQTGEKPPKRLADVYGSRWITAGMGSVALLWGEPGDLAVELRHLKQPAEEVGPLQVVHDHAAGASTVPERTDPLEALRRSRMGLAAPDLAVLDGGETKPRRNDVEKARRKLERLARSGLASRSTDPNGAIRYLAVEDRP